MARPTKYCEEILEKTRAYISGAYKEGDDPEVIPTFEGLSLYIDVHKDTLYDWASQEDKKAFSDELGRLKAKQGRALISGGISGAYNPTIAKLLLHGHGHSDKQEVTGKDGAPLNPVLADEDRDILKRYMESKK